MEPISPSKSKLQVMGFTRTRRILIIGTAIFTVLILVMVCGVFMTRPNINHYESKRGTYYTVVLDCGSTGSRVNVYKWMFKDGSKLPLLLESYPENSDTTYGCQYHCRQTEPGLDKFVGNASGVMVSLEPLIRLAEQWVPVDKHSLTPIFVLATAGMRKLEAESARLVLEDVQKVLKKHSFFYRKDWIRVLSGTEEAHYGWVSLNYKMGIFGNLSRLPSLGLLDLGGSSLQVVTEVDKSRDGDHIMISKVGSFERRILAYSLPAFGLNEAFDRSVVLLTHSEALRERGNGVFEVLHPCLSSSFLQNYTCLGCFVQNRIISENLTSMMEEKRPNTVLLGGSSNWEQCKEVARASAVNLSNPTLPQQSKNSNCIGLSSLAGSMLLNVTSHPNMTRHYNAMSGFFAIYSRLNLSRTANSTNMWETGEHLCPKLWSDHTSTSGQDCFRVPYMASLIEDALCLRNVEVVFGPGDISWTLGAAMIEGDYLWHSTATSDSDIFSLRYYKMISSPFPLFVLLLFLLLVVHYNQVKLPMPSRDASCARACLPSYLCCRSLLF
ncbi:OLC1v1013122C1 [Oldenlandia corymbosa var. corymbosa]|uniref:OLC1v1013122C1 n=1 Tax=Oldenlandia corymbosa var. corymbosa TaxID=529605 RepID=A0AAV1E0T9_OLDCO|nr:OLC1v1013122C1 [Oldenlandia corymbosa var. corymbosa]